MFKVSDGAGVGVCIFYPLLLLPFKKINISTYDTENKNSKILAPILALLCGLFICALLGEITPLYTGLLSIGLLVTIFIRFKIRKGIDVDISKLKVMGPASIWLWAGHCLFFFAMILDDLWIIKIRHYDFFSLNSFSFLALLFSLFLIFPFINFLSYLSFRKIRIH